MPGDVPVCRCSVSGVSPVPSCSDVQQPCMLPAAYRAAKRQSQHFQICCCLLVCQWPFLACHCPSWLSLCFPHVQRHGCGWDGPGAAPAQWDQGWCSSPALSLPWQLGHGVFLQAVFLACLPGECFCALVLCEFCPTPAVRNQCHQQLCQGPWCVLCNEQHSPE